jgi:hypothetical protein
VSAGDPRRCPSKIAHESGVVKQCQFVHLQTPPVPDIHGTIDGVLWRGDDDRVATEAPPRDWGEWAPGRGVERMKAERPEMVPDLTEEDFAKADAIIDAAGRATVNAELIDPRRAALDRLADDHTRVRERVLADPERREAYIQARIDMAYARGISEGRRLAAEAVGRLRRIYSDSSAWGAIVEVVFDDVAEALQREAPDV